MREAELLEDGEDEEDEAEAKENDRKKNFASSNSGSITSGFPNARRFGVDFLRFDSLCSLLL